MSKRKINLEEILQDCWITTLDNSKEIHASIEDVKSVMIEFGKQLLELAAENANLIEYNTNKTAFTAHNMGVNKQSITDTIYQVE